MAKSADRASRAVTLTDVARLAGVSVSTASKALNGRDEVAESTRARVLRTQPARCPSAPTRSPRGC